MKRYDVITAMDLCVDILIDLGETEPEFGQKEKLVNDYNLELGGSAAIFASQASKLGLSVAGIGNVGDDYFGKFILDKLTGSGIIMDFIKTDPNIKTGVGVALCRKDDRAILTYTGTIDSVSPSDFSSSLIKNTRHIHIGSYYLMKKLQYHYYPILKIAKENGVTISLDPNWDPEEKWEDGIKEILTLVDIFFINENEALGISKKNNLDDALKILSEHLPLIVIKKGDKGSMGISDKGSFKMAALDVDVKDAVGAGDNFDAGFIYGFLAGFDIEKCLHTGNICGSISTTKSGGILGQPFWDTVASFLEQ